MRKLTIKEVIARIKKVHGDVVTLDENTYMGTKIKCRFVDKDHGEWWATPSNIMRGRNHPTRGKEKRVQSRTTTLSAVKNGIKKIHGDVVKIDEPTYINVITKCRFIDKDYGEWFTCPRYVLYGRSHPKRTIEKKRQTDLKKYGVTHHMKNSDILKKTKHTNLERYGVGCSLLSKEAREKTKKTNLKKYGVENVMHNLEIARKCVLSYFEKSEAELLKIRERVKKTNLKKYGVENVMHNLEIARKCARAQQNSFILIHWKTGEEITCQASYEKAVVKYLNSNKINFRWQHKIFKMPDGHTYRPDLYLFSTKKWIEIKGYFWGPAQKKWEWFHKEYPNSELWNEDKLKEMKII